jgi:mannuronan synthase
VLSVLRHVVFILFVVAFATAIPGDALGEKPRDLFLVLGIIGIWRYAWGLLHFVRCLWFKLVAFPRARQFADRAAQEFGFGHAFLLVTSFRIDAATTSKVYAAAFEAASCAPGGGIHF